MNCYLYVNSSKITDNHRAAIKEYQKRLSPYCSVELITGSNIVLPKDIYKSDHRLLYIKKGVSTYSSTELSDYINTMQINGISTLHVAIGFNESCNDADAISITQADLSFPTVTLLFIEQLYRSYTILTGKTYHK